jgi:hypothetical protein
MFKRAERKRAKLRLAIIGPSGSGKTYSALLIAKGLGGKAALIDTERGSGSLYCDLLEYDTAELTPPFSPDRYISAIQAAEKMGYEVLIIDSLSHAWAGEGGVLEFVDKASQAERNNFAAWRKASPIHNRLVDTMLMSNMHIIVTMRSKTAWEVQKDERTGKTKPVKIGLAPVQREGLEYEFTCVLELSLEGHVATASKDRTRLFDGKYFTPDMETGKSLNTWLNSGQNPSTPPQSPFQANPSESSKPQMITEAQVKKINALASKMDLDREEKIARINAWLKYNNNGNARDVSTTKDLTKDEASGLIEAMSRKVQEQEEAHA